jgi:hypothetical protein
VKCAEKVEAYPATWDDELEMSLLAGERALFDEGNLQEGRKYFDAAYGEAERQCDGPGMARAALGLGGLWVHEHRTAADAAVVRVRQRDALTLVDPRSPLALRLRIRLAAAEDYGTGGHTAILSGVEEARSADDPVPLAEALSLAYQCLLGPDHAALRLELARELIDQAARTNRRIDLLTGLLWQAVDLVLAADPFAERRLEELRALLAREEHLAIGFVLSTIEVMLCIRSGRFADAEAMAAASVERGAAAGDADAAGWYISQLGTIRWYQGRIAEFVPKLRELMNSPMLSVVDNISPAGLALAAATAGDRRLAAGILARVRGGELAGLPRPGSWLTSMYSVVEAAHLLADAQTSARAYALLRPFARLPVTAVLGIICLGSVHHCLGVASLTTGDLERAVGHLREAVHDNIALGHWPAVALSRSRLGQALALRDGPRDEAARRELAVAAQEAAALGMVLPGTTGTAGTAGERAPVVVCRRRGRQWLIELGGRRALIDDSIGMRHLSALLANPGYEIAATDLAAGPVIPGTAPAHDPGTSAQPVLDDQAKATYKQRLSQLQDELEEFAANNEFDRAAAVRAERDWLIAELAAAAGLNGRSRRFTDSRERARIAVGKAIRRALARIAEADSVIADELRATVHTGLRCCYRPDPN